MAQTSIRVKAILPKDLDWRAIEGELVESMRQVGKIVESDFQDTTASWEHKPEFRTDETIQRGYIREFVYTESDIYRYVSGGTGSKREGGSSYPIRAVNAKVLAYPSIFTPKTEPNWAGSQAGGKAGPMVFAVEVEHPGIEPRNFPQAIKEKREKWIQRIMYEAMQRAAKASGHGMP